MADTPGIDMPLATYATINLCIWRDLKIEKGEAGIVVYSATEVGLILLTLASSIETIIRAIFTILLLPLQFFNCSRPFHRKIAISIKATENTTRFCIGALYYNFASRYIFSDIITDVKSNKAYKKGIKALAKA